MSEQLTLPLNDQAAGKADDQFYANHPEMVQDGQRVPLDPDDPAQAGLRKEWVGLYQAKDGEIEKSHSNRRKPADHTQACPLCSARQGLLVLTVVEPDETPVEGALVTADALQKKTDRRGIADFGAVDAKTYKIAASKDGYSMADPHDATIEVEPQRKNAATLVLAPCVAYRHAGKPLLIAAAAERLTPPIQTIDIPGSVGGPLKLDFGQDTTFGIDGVPVTGYVLEQNETELRATMYKLLDYFAKDDTAGNAQREFDTFMFRAFLNKRDNYKGPIGIYSDPYLDRAIDQRFAAYEDMALGAPGTQQLFPGPTIHKALEAAGFDVNKVVPFAGLAVPKFNFGQHYPKESTGDWSNGLAVMIDAVQHVLVFVDRYEYDRCKEEYTISLIFELYDVFGLDDDDLETFGATGSIVSVEPQEGITAWWQLQHLEGYAPMITRATVARTFKVSTK